MGYDGLVPGRGRLVGGHGIQTMVDWNPVRVADADDAPLEVAEMARLSRGAEPSSHACVRLRCLS